MREHGSRASAGMVTRIVARLLLLLSFVLAVLPDAEAATFEEGVSAYEAGRWPDAARIWQGLADAGDPRSQHAIASLYESGRGLPQNYAMAAEWYTKAAAQGLPSAQNDLAVLYSKGRGVDRDPAKAVQLWQAAAAQGHLKAQYNLGLAYYLGEGVGLDDQAAIAWFNTAAKGGLAEAQFVLGQMYRMGAGVPADQQAALDWYELAAAQGHVEAQAKADELIAAGVRPIGPVEGVPPSQEQSAELVAAAASDVPVPDTAEPVGDNGELPEDAGGGKMPAIIIMPAAVDEAIAAEAAAAGPAPPPLKPEKEVELALVETVEPESVAEATAVQVAEAPAEAAPAEEPAAAPTGTQVASLTVVPGDGLLWLGTGVDEAEAKGLARVLNTRFPEVFQQLPPRVEAKDIGGKTRWRVLAGPLDTAAAAELCQALRAIEPNLFCKALPPA